MKTYVCEQGHLSYSSASIEDLYFPYCSEINCSAKVIELPKSRLEVLAEDKDDINSNKL